MNVDFFLSDQFVWGYCGLIVVLLFGISGKLVYEAIPLYRSLRDVKAELIGLQGERGFVRSFEKYNILFLHTIQSFKANRCQWL